MTLAESQIKRKNSEAMQNQTQLNRWKYTLFIELHNARRSCLFIRPDSKAVHLWVSTTNRLFPGSANWAPGKQDLNPRNDNKTDYNCCGPTGMQISAHERNQTLEILESFLAKNLSVIFN